MTATQEDIFSQRAVLVDLTKKKKKYVMKLNSRVRDLVRGST
jgi:hypothetical protein